MRELKLPPGAVALTIDDAVTALVTQDHVGAESGTIEQDAVMIAYIKSGLVCAARLADGQLAFAQIPGNEEIWADEDRLLALVQEWS